jgi:hypothetical protein
MEGHGGQGWLPFLLHLPYYPLVLAVGFLPWTIYLSLVPGSFRNAARPMSTKGWARSPEGLRILLLAMILPVFVLMTLVVSKLPHYIQPVFPWFAILVAAALAGIRRRSRHQLVAGRMRWSLLVFGVPSVLAVLAILALPWIWAPADVFRSSGTILGLFLLGWLLVLGVNLWRGRIFSAVWAHAIGMLMFTLGAALFVLPTIETFAKPAQRLGIEVGPLIPSGAEIAVFGWYEPSLHFYLGARPIQRLHDPVSLQEWLSGPGPRVLILNESVSSGLTLPPAGYRPLATQTGIDHVGGKTTRLTAFLRE